MTPMSPQDRMIHQFRLEKLKAKRLAVPHMAAQIYATRQDITSADRAVDIANMIYDEVQRRLVDETKYLEDYIIKLKAPAEAGAGERIPSDLQKLLDEDKDA